MIKRGFFCNKRAVINEAYHILIQIFIAISAFWIMQSFIDSVVEDTLFEKEYLSNDLALITEAIYSSPGDIYYEYDNPKANLYTFNFNFREQSVSIKEAGAEKPIAISVAYGEDKNINNELKELIRPQKIFFKKTQTKIIADQHPIDTTKYSDFLCSKINTKKEMSTINIVLYDYQSTSETKAVIQTILKKIQKLLQEKSAKVEILELKDIASKSNDYDMIIGLKIKNQNSNVLSIDYPISHDDFSLRSNNKLSCLLANQIRRLLYPDSLPKVRAIDNIPVDNKYNINLLITLNGKGNEIFNKINSDNNIEILSEKISNSIIKFYQE